MGKTQNTREMLDYITNPLSRENIELLYSSNFIAYERCDLYKDYVLSFVTLVFDTYMGDDVTNEKQKQEHFNWCWKKTIDNFLIEGISFSNLKELREYFRAFMSDSFYSDVDKFDEELHRKIIKLWKHIFNYHIVKTRSDVDALLDVYKMFEKSLKKGKKLAF